MADDPISVEDIGKGIVQPSSQPDEKTLQETKDLEQQAKTAQLKSLRQDIDARKEYATRIFRLIVAWVVAILALLTLQGFGVQGFKLSDAVNYRCDQRYDY